MDSLKASTRTYLLLVCRPETSSPGRSRRSTPERATFVSFCSRVLRVLRSLFLSRRVATRPTPVFAKKFLVSPARRANAWSLLVARPLVSQHPVYSFLRFVAFSGITLPSSPFSLLLPVFQADTPFLSLFAWASSLATYYALPLSHLRDSPRLPPLLISPVLSSPGSITPLLRLFARADLVLTLLWVNDLLYTPPHLFFFDDIPEGGPPSKLFLRVNPIFLRCRVSPFCSFLFFLEDITRDPPPFFFSCPLYELGSVLTAIRVAYLPSPLSIVGDAITLPLFSSLYHRSFLSSVPSSVPGFYAHVSFASPEYFSVARSLLPPVLEMRSGMV